METKETKTKKKTQKKFFLMHLTSCTIGFLEPLLAYHDPQTSVEEASPSSITILYFPLMMTTKLLGEGGRWSLPLVLKQVFEEACHRQ